MNGRPNLEGLDLELLARIQREQDAELRRAAWVAQQLRGESILPGKKARAMLKWKLAAAIGALLPLILFLVRAANAAGASGGGGGLRHFFM